LLDARWSETWRLFPGDVFLNSVPVRFPLHIARSCRRRGRERPLESGEQEQVSSIVRAAEEKMKGKLAGVAETAP
jgi:hypothetical protein